MTFRVRESCAVAVDIPDAATLLARVEDRLRAGEGVAVATLNLDHLVKLRLSAAFRAAYARQSHVTADGRPVVWLSRLAGRRVGLVTGADLVHPLAALAARTGMPVALLGADAPTLSRAAERLGSAHPGLVIVARVAPPYGLDPEGAEAMACLDRVRAAGARLCLLALGAPRQEILAARGLERVPGCVFVSVGAGIDFVAGTQRRAPLWMRRLALEWVWRMASDPRRLAGRYLRCAAILPGLALDALRLRLSKRAGRDGARG